MENKTLILDWSKWRCGDNGKHALGKGITALKNAFGFECCLGMFSKQLNPKIQDENILGFGEPGELTTEIPLLNFPLGDELEEEESYPKFYNSCLSDDAISINDDESSTPEEKVELLKQRFAETGYTIEVINKPTN